MRKINNFLSLAIITICVLFNAVSAQKLKAEDIVAKHLDSIGKAENRKSIKNQVATGTVSFTVLRQGGTGGDGKIVLASEGNKSLLGMTFTIPTYPSETVIFDGKKLNVGFPINNARSSFGDFLYRYNDTFKEGLFGGTLNSGWVLADLSNRKAKLSLDGSEKINGRDTYELSYLPKGGSDLQIKIFIDKETFEHVRTEYRRIISAQQGPTPETSSQQREQRQILIEDFSDYKKEKDLNLPHSYRIYLFLEGASGTREFEWKAVFSQFYFNQQLDPNTFNSDSK